MSEQPLLPGEQLTEVTFKVRVGEAAAQQRAHDGAAVAGALRLIREVHIPCLLKKVTKTDFLKNFPFFKINLY